MLQAVSKRFPSGFQMPRNFRISEVLGNFTSSSSEPSASNLSAAAARPQFSKSTSASAQSLRQASALCWMARKRGRFGQQAGLCILCMLCKLCVRWISPIDVGREVVPRLGSQAALEQSAQLRSRTCGARLRSTSVWGQEASRGIQRHQDTLGAPGALGAYAQYA